VNFYLIGVDYKSAPSEIRQKLYLKRSQIASFWGRITLIDSAILLTCNRFDISIAAGSEEQIVENLELFRKEFPLFYAHCYIKKNIFELLRYGFRLACGLESQLKGEFQILEQLQVWLKQDKLPQRLFEFWSRILKSASLIRFKSGLNCRENNIAKLLFEDLNNLNPGNGKLDIAVVGTGKVAALIAEYKPERADLFFVAHKNRLKAEVLANRVGARVLSFAQLKTIIPHLHVLVSAASSPHIILKSGDIPDSVLERDKPLYIYDLGFPVNIANELGNRKNILLKNLDDLALSAKINNGNYSLAEYLIEEAIKEDEYIKSWHAAQPLSH
jgi:glutamyl-tRNA reductase